MSGAPSSSHENRRSDGLPPPMPRRMLADENVVVSDAVASGPGAHRCRSDGRVDHNDADIATVVPSPPTSQPALAPPMPNTEWSSAIQTSAVATLVMEDGDDSGRPKSAIVAAESVSREGCFQNKRKTLCMLAVMLALVCGLAIGLGASLNSGGSNSSGDTPVPSVFENVTDPIAGEAGSQFGSSVSLCGDGSRVAVAGPGTGVVQVFELLDEGGRIQLGQNITYSNGTVGSSRYVRTGLVVDLSNDCSVLAVGLPYAMVSSEDTNQDIKDAGKVEVYKFNDANDVWEPLGEPILGEDEGQYAGASVSLSHDGGLVAIGYPGNLWNSGNVRVFEFDVDSWEMKGSTIYGPFSPFSNQAFGGSVSLSHINKTAIVAVGCSTGTGIDNNAAAYVFQYKSGNWERRGSRIVPETVALNGIESSWFVQLSEDGMRLVISNLYLDEDGVVISRSNEGLYVAPFVFSEDWVRVGKNLHQNFTGPKSGYVISLNQDGTRIGMGDPGSEAVGGLTGHAHFYQLIDGNQWCQFGPNIVGDAPGDAAGFSVSISGDGKRIVVGSPRSRALGHEHGQIRIYDIKDEDVVPECKKV